VSSVVNFFLWRPGFAGGLRSRFPVLEYALCFGVPACSGDAAVAGDVRFHSSADRPFSDGGLGGNERSGLSKRTF